MEEKRRCNWCIGDPLYEKYHDEEWGVPLKNDRQLFEFLILETFQAGLSWITILRKRENFREAFDDFNYKKIANYSEAKVDELMQKSEIIRNKLKIMAAIANAKAFLEIQKEFSTFSNYIWAFVNHEPVQHSLNSSKEAPAKTELSIVISKDLKTRGFKFVGPTIIYAHMQATGMVNDHETSCFRHEEVQQLK